jgi:hypothetical protein
MYYKDQNNALYFLDDAVHEHLLPAGCVKITDKEAESLRPVPPPTTVQDQLAQLDADNALTQSNLRETVMLMTEAFKQITGGTLNLSSIPGVAKVYEVEAQAAILRGRI